MAGEPNELPEGGEGGGGWGGLGGWRGEFPQELPVGPDYALGAILREIFTVRARVQQLENVQIAASVMGTAGGARFSTAALRINRPDELPEGGEGGGSGGWGGWPGGWPGERPEPELPPFAWLQRVTELETQLASMSAALERIEGQLAKLGGQVQG